VTAGSPLPGDGEEMLGEVEPVHIEPGFREEMRVPSLAARCVENPGASGKAEQLDHPRNLEAVPLCREERLVLQEVLGIKV
jgi:hypothetical protein